MPELPEVETMCRGIAPVVGGCIRDVRRPPSSCRAILIRPRIDHLRRRLLGRTVTAVERLGKRVVLRVDRADALVIEPRMTGLVLLADPPDQRHLRLEIRLSGAGTNRLWFWDRRGLGVVRLLTADELARELGPHRLGPDALAISRAELRLRLATSRRAIKVALLDQTVLAGIGNLYASELLHVAGVPPQCPCDSLDNRDWQRIHAAMRRVLRQAIRYEGSTLADGAYRNALNQAGGYQNHHQVYDREGEHCRTCRAARVVRLVQAQRSTFYCPRCQPSR